MKRDAEFLVEKRGGFTVIKPQGRLGLKEAEALGAFLVPLAASEAPFVAIDLGAVDFLGSLAIGVLVQARSEAQKRKGQIFLACPPDSLKEIIRVSRLDMLFEILPSLESLAGCGEAPRDSASRIMAPKEQQERVRQQAGEAGGAAR